ncbi:type III pantothenate kinase [bacterium]|nr:type III pantothenate kinase [bacterium]
MLLAVDIGNTQTSLGAFEGEQLLFHWRIETRSSRTADEYASLLFPLFAQRGLSGESWKGIALCSVVPSVDGQFMDFCRRYLGQDPVRIHSALPLGFSMNLATPHEVGADRLVNVAYAIRKLPLPCIVVDFGTATTFDFISEDLVYQGGAIVPGLWMGAEGLGGKTAKLPVIDLAFPASVIGKSTVECIQSGLLYGYCALIDGMLSRIESECGKPCHVALTGGLSSLFAGRLEHECQILPDLTLEGIRILYQEVAGQDFAMRPFAAEPIH